jgi:hypothetical protein
MLFFVSIYGFGLLAFAIHYYTIPFPQRTSKRQLELFLLYQIVFSLGLTSIIAFFGLTFLNHYVASYTGWPQSPFEQQLANVNLAFGILGILCIWLRKLFWVATIVGFSIWILCDGLHHLYEFLILGNASEGNIGIPLYTDFAVPIVLLILLYFYLKNERLRL